MSPKPEINFKWLLSQMIVSVALFALQTFILSLGLMCLFLAYFCALALLSQSEAVALNKIATLNSAISHGAFENIFLKVFVGVFLFRVGISKFWTSTIWRLKK